MSTNVSLGDTPGVSAYFDGQPIQDQQEAELRREEEKQEKELRRLLETELEDFEDDEDFLSGSNSEEDCGNQSTNSGHHSIRSSIDFQAQSDHDGIRRDPNDRFQSRGNLHQRGEPLDPTTVKGQEDFGSEGEASFARHDRKSPNNTNPPSSYASFPGQTSSRSPLDPRHFLGGLNGDGSWPNRGFNSDAFSPGHLQNQADMFPTAAVHIQTNIQEDPLLRSPRSSTGELNRDLEMRNFMQYNGFNSESRQSKDFEKVHEQDNQQDSDFPSLNARQAGNIANGDISNSNVKSSATAAAVADDEWMMKIQTAATPSHHHHHHPHHYSQQQQLQPSYNQPFTAASSQVQSQPPNHMGNFKHHHRVPVAVASAFYAKSPQGPSPNPTQSSSAFSPKSLSNFPAKFSHQPHHHHHQEDHYQHQRQQNHQYHLHHQQDGQHQPQQLRQEASSSPPPPPLPATLPPTLPTPTSQTAPTLPSLETQYKVIPNKQSRGNVPEEDEQYKVVYKNQNSLPNGEERFYLTNEQTEFFNKDGPEDQMRYDQLEILYRARGREVEELKRKIEEKESEVGREKRALKHRAAVAEGEANGANESLKQTQRLLQQAKADNAEAHGKISGLEKELSAFHDAKEELLKKLAQAESTIETLTQHVTELSESDSVSRARREHEAVVSTLAQRHQREILVLKEQLDVAKTELSTKTQELTQTREQLGEATLALEQAQVSRGETVNRLSRSLEESQRRCQEFLQQLGEDGAARELATLRVKLGQSQESTRISEELCRSYQHELKEAKEQLSMLEAATTLGAISSLSSATSGNGRAPHPAPSADDSMTDLGIRRTLDFNTTPQSEGRCDATDHPPAHDDLVTSLRSELERCLRSNREKRSEVTELRGQVKQLTSDLEKAIGQLEELEKTCSHQKKRLTELRDLMGDGESGLGAVEARLKRDLDKMGLKKQALLDDIKDYQQRLEEIGASEAQLTEINAELSQQLSAMVARGDQDKAHALARCQRTMEETGRITVENLRREMAERHATEVESLTSRGERQVAELRQELSSALKELDDVKALYVNVCQESAAQEAELTEKFKQQLEAESQKIEDRVELEKKEWREFIREEVRKSEEEERKTAEGDKLSQLESELEAKWQKEIELKIAQTRLETLQEQRKTIEEEKQDWEMHKTQLEETLRQRKEEVSLLSSQLETARGEIRSLREKITKSNEQEKRQCDNTSGCHNDVLEGKGEVTKSNEQEKGESNTSRYHNGVSEENREETELKEDLEETLIAWDISNAEGTGLASMSIEASEIEDCTVMKTLQADKTRETENLSTGLEETEDTKIVDNNCRDVSEFADIKARLREKKAEVEGLKEEFDNKCKELDGKGRELEELQRKGRELEEALRQREAELADVREKMRVQVDESAQEVEKYRQKIEKLEKEVEKMKDLELAQNKNNGYNTSNDVKPSQEYSSMGRTEGSGKKEFVDVQQSQGHDLDPEGSEQLKELVQTLREKLRAETECHEAELARQKEVHRVEFERAARQREEKFQSELRYFLKEREERGRSRAEEAVRECREKCEEEFRASLREREEKARGEFETSLRDARREHGEEKSRMERDFERRLEEERERWRKEGRNKEKGDKEETISKTYGLTDGGDAVENPASTKFSQGDVNSLANELQMNRQDKEKLKLFAEEKDGQIVAMALRHEAEEKTLREKFEREMEELKEVYTKQVKALEGEMDSQRKRFEEASKQIEISATAKLTVEALKTEAELEEKLEGKVLKSVEEKVQKEMQANLEEKVRKEMQAEVEENVKKLEREARDNGREKEEDFIEEEVEKRVGEKLQEERGKWFKDAEDYISSEVRRGVEDRLRGEEDKRKGGFDKEVDDKVKWRVEEERARLHMEAEEKIKERVKEKLNAELTSLKKKFSAELGARIGAEKSRLEQEVAEWKKRATREIEVDREKWTQDMKARVAEEREKWVRERKTLMEKRISEERRKLEAELRLARDGEIADLRRELEGEMRRRINKEREEWEEEAKQEQQRRGEREKREEDGETFDTVTVEERLKSEVEARSKACAERDRAVAYIREREVSYKEERQRLVAGLERCRDDLQGMKEEHRELEEKCAAMDRRYKEDMKIARRRREEDLQNLRKTLEQEKHEAVASWEEKVQALREECGNAVERARSEGELEKASLLAEVQRHTEQALEKSSLPNFADTDSSTILELRDHYLDTVAKIKADVMSHVQEANSRAAATMRAQIRKQRVKVVEEFKLKVKACLKAALTGEVSTSCITALENSIETLAQQLLSSAASSSSSSGNTPRSGPDKDKAKLAADLVKYDTASDYRKGSSPHFATTGVLTEEGKDGLKAGKKHRRGFSPKRVSPPQKDMAERGVNNFDTAYDDLEDAHHKEQRTSDDLIFPAAQNSCSQDYKGEVMARASPQLRLPHPQLDGVDLFDTSNSQHATTPPPLTRTHSNFTRAGASPSRKPTSATRPNFTKEKKREQQQQWLSKVTVPSSTAGTMGGDTTPVSSNASSPRASPTPTHQGNKPTSGGDKDLRLKLDLEHSPYVTTTRGSGARDEDMGVSKPKISFRETSKFSKKSHQDVETSPRDQMKLMEARVRLANWAKSGTAPWTTSVTLEKTDAFPGKFEKIDESRREEISLEQRTFSWEEGEEGIEERGRKFSNGGGTVTKEGFRVPGTEAENWVRSQKRIGFRKSEYSDRTDGNQELSDLVGHSSRQKARQNRSDEDEYERRERVGILKAVVMAEDQFLSSDESVVSNGSHSSFVTLEPEEKTSLVASGMYKESVRTTDDRSRGRGLGGSLTSQIPADSGLPSSTRTAISSNGGEHERGVSPYRKERKGEADDNREDFRSQDHQRGVSPYRKERKGEADDNREDFRSQDHQQGVSPYRKERKGEADDNREDFRSQDHKRGVSPYRKERKGEADDNREDFRSQDHQRGVSPYRKERKGEADDNREDFRSQDHQRGVSPYRKERKGGAGNNNQDYERIRAAVLRGGEDLRDRVDLGIGGSTTFSDDEMSLEEFRKFPFKSADRYSRPKHALPTSTPLVKQSLTSAPRAWSESRVDSRRGKGQRGKFKGDGTRGRMNEGHYERDDTGSMNEDKWRHLGGKQFVDSDRFAWEDDRNNRKEYKQRGGRGGERPSPTKSGSLPQHSRSVRSHDQGRRLDDLVLKSVDQLPLTSSAFPSDLSRITQVSATTDESGPQGMWRYRSLEDLIGGRGENSDRLRVYQHPVERDEVDGREGDDGGRKRSDFRSNSRERRSLSGNESFGGESSSNTWYNMGRRDGPIQAMDSEFWERQRSEQDEPDEEGEEEEEENNRGRRNHGRKLKGNSKMQRSTSEQSLHTLHGAGSNHLGKTADGVDALLAHYLSPAKSSFDLRPFAREEHF